MSVDPKLIVQMLRSARARPPKLSQEEAAKIAEVSTRMWGRYEMGEVVPPIEVLIRFAKDRRLRWDLLIPTEELQLEGAMDLGNEHEVPIVARIPAGPLLQGFGEEGIIGHIRSEIRDPAAFCLLVTGLSMYPEIQENDVVLCSPAEPFVSGKVYATVTADGEQSLKRVRRDDRAKAYALIPANKEFPTLYVPEEQVLKLIRVVEVRRDLQ